MARRGGRFGEGKEQGAARPRRRRCGGQCHVSWRLGSSGQGGITKNGADSYLTLPTQNTQPTAASSPSKGELQRAVAHLVVNKER